MCIPINNEVIDADFLPAEGKWALAYRFFREPQKRQPVEAMKMSAVLAAHGGFHALSRYLKSLPGLRWRQGK